jgi:hypothetical protein
MSAVPVVCARFGRMVTVQITIWCVLYYGIGVALCSLLLFTCMYCIILLDVIIYQCHGINRYGSSMDVCMIHPSIIFFLVWYVPWSVALVAQTDCTVGKSAETALRV